MFKYFTESSINYIKLGVCTASEPKYVKLSIKPLGSTSNYKKCPYLLKLSDIIGFVGSC